MGEIHGKNDILGKPHKNGEFSACNVYHLYDRNYYQRLQTEFGELDGFYVDSNPAQLLDAKNMQI